MATFLSVKDGEDKHKTAKIILLYKETVFEESYPECLMLSNIFMAEEIIPAVRGCQLVKVTHSRCDLRQDSSISLASANCAICLN